MFWNYFYQKRKKAGNLFTVSALAFEIKYQNELALELAKSLLLHIITLSEVLLVKAFLLFTEVRMFDVFIFRTILCSFRMPFCKTSSFVYIRS